MKRKNIMKFIIASIIGGIIGAILSFIGSMLIYKKPEIYGNVADWVSGIGSIGAIIFVYFQINASQIQSKNQIEESRKQLKKQLDAEREKGFQQARPLFKITKIPDVSLNDIDVLSNDYTNVVHSKTDYSHFINNDFNSELDSKVGYKNKSFHYFFLKNISENRMLAVRALFIYKDTKSKTEDKHYFFIDTIGNDERVNLVDNWLVDESPKKLIKIEITFNSNMRELINLVFDVDDNDIPRYNRSMSYVENKDREKVEKKPKDYSLDDFNESEKYHL